MIKDQSREQITQKDQLVEQMVNKTYKLMRELGQFQTVHEIFGKLPISRIEKQQYQFLFDSVRQNVTETLHNQNQLIKILKQEGEAIAKIEVRTYREKKLLEKDRDNKDKGTVSFGKYDFSHLVDNCFGEKTPSGRPINKAVLYMRNQLRKGLQPIGEPQPFLPDQVYINFKEIKHEIGDIRLLLEDEPKLKKFDLQFDDQNKILFKSRSFPSNYEIEKRAQTLAKLYLLHLYRDEGRKAKQIYRSNQIQNNKQREIRMIKQEMDLQKMKQGEMIEEMDLIKQVYKILMLIEKKMNELAFNEFQNKKGAKSAAIKRSLQKIKMQVHEEPSAKNKLKILISYKHSKGW